ncbi:hypothetical protein LP7551_00644 [Roseibium album]|nr:hypothetical protein LP7551_00644 [Roseibium album]
MATRIEFAARCPGIGHFDVGDKKTFFAMRRPCNAAVQKVESD